MVRSLLFPLSLLYKTVVQLRRKLFEHGILKSHSLPGFVISVGNLEAGGTGKTPFVVALARHLKSQGSTPAILTRGYRSGLDGNDSMAFMGTKTVMAPVRDGIYHPDEGKMQAVLLENVPVIIGANRVEAASRYLQSHPPPNDMSVA